jgi:hypothetical protein
MLGNYRVATQLVASRVVLSSTELVSYNIVLWHPVTRFTIILLKVGLSCNISSLKLKW